MSASGFLAVPESVLEQKVGGLKLMRLLDYNETSAWYEGQEDAGEKKIVYLYEDRNRRDEDKSRVQDFKTALEESLLSKGVTATAYASVGGYRVAMVRRVKEYLSSPGFLSQARIGGYTLDAVLGSGYKGVTFKARREGGPGTAYALKLTVAEEYEGGSYLPEVHRMTDLAHLDRQHFPQIHACDQWTCEIGGETHALVYFVEDLMPGVTLEGYLRRSPDSLSVVVLENFVRHMLSALSTLEKCDLMHDDLHAGNIMIHDYLGETYISLIDFGSAKRRTPTKKTRDDLRNLASHIARIMNILDLDPQPTTRYEDAALTACRSLHAVMSDDDPLRQRESAGVLLQDINKYYPRGSFEQHLTRPFDFGNAEEVMDNKLLHQLASTSFPWKDKIESSSHMLIVGPRGCGKTTVFRSLSFNCLADADQMGEALSRPYVGLYISCNKEFRLRFSALAPEVLKHREEDLRHYFNLLVLREFAAVMIACHEKSQLGHQDVQQFAEFCREACGLATEPASPPRTLLRSIESRVTQAIGKARMHIWGNEPCDNRTQQDLVARLARFMGEMAGPLHGKLLYLFVDDYTERKVPQEAQRALNHILFVPNALYRSKISSEVFGVAPDQTFGDFLVQDRDYKEWNLGTLYYLDLPSDGKKQFLRDIVNTRLRLCEYKGTVDDVIGPSEYPDGSLARALRLDAGGEVAATKTQKAYYHGWDTICDLCTGDISNILEILDRIYGECAVRKSSKSKVDQERQHQAIEGYSLQYTAKIKGIPKYGEKLFEIVDAFGNMCKRLLREHPVIDRGDGRQDPYQLLRIELDEGFVRSSAHVLQVESQGIAEREASDRPAILWMLLQRYCIFIDAEPSRSRRNTLASKVIMRRIFCPAFKMGLVNSESYTLDKKHWEAFCANPKGESERYARTANDHPLFGDEQEG